MDHKEELLSLPANVPETYLYASDGLYYYASNCCDPIFPHSGVVASSTQLTVLGCGNASPIEDQNTPGESFRGQVSRLSFCATSDVGKTNEKSTSIYIEHPDLVSIPSRTKRFVLRANVSGHPHIADASLRLVHLQFRGTNYYFAEACHSAGNATLPVANVTGPIRIGEQPNGQFNSILVADLRLSGIRYPSVFIVLRDQYTR